MEWPVVPVRVEKLVAPRHRGANATLAQSVVHPRTDVECVIIEQDAHLGLLTRRGTFVGLLLMKVGDRGRARPCRFVEPTVDTDRADGDACRSNRQRRGSGARLHFRGTALRRRLCLNGGPDTSKNRCGGECRYSRRMAASNFNRG